MIKLKNGAKVLVAETWITRSGDDGIVLADRGPDSFHRYVTWSVWCEPGQDEWGATTGSYYFDLDEAVEAYQERRDHDRPRNLHRQIEASLEHPEVVES